MWTGSHLLSESAQHVCLEETLVTYLSVSVLKKWLRTPTRPHTEALGNELQGCSQKLFFSDPRAFRGIREECQAAGCWWHWLRQPVVPLAQLSMLPPTFRAWSVSGFLGMSSSCDRLGLVSKTKNVFISIKRETTPDSKD